LTSELSKKWFEEIYLPITGNDSTLCLDSWTGQKETNFINIRKGTKKVKVCTIPPGTTPIAQPLDVYGFRHSH